MRPEENRQLFFKKDMGIFARAGFSFEVSRKILELPSIEFQKLIKII